MNIPVSEPKPFLVFGLVGPIGTNLEMVGAHVKKALELTGYQVSSIRLSKEVIPPIATKLKIKATEYSTESPEAKRYEDLMKQGTGIRTKLDSGEALAVACIDIIHKDSQEHNSKSPRAVILHSLKHPKEVTFLRRIYGLRFSVIACSLPRESRLKDLCNRIAQASSSLHKDAYRPDAERLMLLDEDESGNKHGQNVRKSFPLADCLIDMSAPDDGTGSLTRYIELLFGQPFHTPTPDEHGMMTAYVSSLRSASMGRQVGAAITTATVEIIATGCNEVPKFGGGLYWHGDQNDHRDHILGHDPSDVLRYRLIGDVIEAFKKQNWLSDAITAREIKDLLQEAISGSDGKTAILQDSEIMNIIEYGRSVHAEMTAITDCARRGVRVQDSAMYTTTFPCHLCARHIVSSGIRRVVYLEPYPKSLVA